MWAQSVVQLFEERLKGGFVAREFPWLFKGNLGWWISLNVLWRKVRQGWVKYSIDEFTQSDWEDWLKDLMFDSSFQCACPASLNSCCPSAAWILNISNWQVSLLHHCTWGSAGCLGNRCSKKLWLCTFPANGSTTGTSLLRFQTGPDLQSVQSRLGATQNIEGSLLEFTVLLVIFSSLSPVRSCQGLLRSHFLRHGGSPLTRHQWRLPANLEIFNG